MATPIPPNAAPFTPAEVARATGGTLVRDGRPFVGVSTDTRTITPGALYVALRGESFDGHRFLPQAAAAGAGGVLISTAGDLPPSGAVICVADTRAALGALGRFHRDRWAAIGHRRVLAVGGSAGKTTTTRAIAALLDVLRPGEVHATPGNLNSDIGLPMTLLLLDEHHHLAAVEIGTSHRGEISTLAAIARPDVGVLTLIAPEHTEGIGTLDDVAAEEGDLFAALPPDGYAIGNGDDPRVATQIERSPALRRILYGFGESCPLRALSREPQGLSGSLVRVAFDGGDPRAYEVPLPGEAGTLAALAALAAAHALLDVIAPPEALREALLRVASLRDGRFAVETFADGTVLLDDTYNSNTGSAKSSLRTARELADSLGRRLLVVLGEMRELGPLAADEHDEVARAAVAAAPAVLVAVNGEAERFAAVAAAAGIPASFHSSGEEAVPFVLESIRPGDVILVKASRGVRLETVASAIRAAR
ncbi:MAG TPA: UDP-N-acetylmuramoyl-tripeptide--D-alanyl-D-alanine ligase [Thermoanaerobaculia bacterium]|nr:UDP-N-acetylmuramoyl-tripeptide--D-alanyl-D-alanine ligase [Thermoanaerobaculia bacterium]